MANRFWGGLANAALPGTPYNRYTQQFNPAATRASLITAGVSQVNPLAGTVTGMFMNRNPRVQAHYAGLQGYEGMASDFNAARKQAMNYQPSVSVPNIGMGGGGLAGLALGGYSPMAGAPVGQGSMDAAIGRGIQQGHDAMSARAQGKLDAAFNGMPAGSVPMGGGWVSGGGGARGAFSTGGYASADARAASIAATQQALQEGRNQESGVRQSHNFYV